MANEKQLIDADALMGKLSRMIECCKTDSKVNGLTALFQVGDAIMDCQTVDAVPVVHGRCDWCNGDYHTKIMATAIRYHSNGNMDGYEVRVNYCPNCGAKMNGDKNNE